MQMLGLHVRWSSLTYVFCPYHTLSPLNSTSSPFSSKYESIVIDPSVSCAEAKLVTLRAGIPERIQVKHVKYCTAIYKTLLVNIV